MEEQAIKFVRLATGEDIVTQLGPMDNDRVTIKNPLKIFYSMMDSDAGVPAMGVSLVYWIFPKLCKSEEFEIDARDILLVSEPSNDLIKYYTTSWEGIRRQKEEDDYLLSDDDISEMFEDEFDMTDEDKDAINDMIEQIRSGGKDKRTLH